MFQNTLQFASSKLVAYSMFPIENSKTQNSFTITNSNDGRQKNGGNSTSPKSDNDGRLKQNGGGNHKQAGNRQSSSDSISDDTRKQEIHQNRINGGHKAAETLTQKDPNYYKNIGAQSHKNTNGKSTPTNPASNQSVDDE